MRGPSIKKTNIPLIQGWFVPYVIEIGQVVLEKLISLNRQCIFTV